MTWGRRSELSDGAKGLWLILDQPSWTYRRVESLSFQASGETRRRISWDFALPHRFTIKAGSGRVAVPIATLSKRPLKRLDVRDATGSVLPVWGREQNGDLAAQVLTAGVEALRQRPVSSHTAETVRDIAYAPGRYAVAKELDQLFRGTGTTDERTEDLSEAVRALAETLADGFLLVVELPASTIGTRSVIKVSYDDDRLRTGAFPERIIGRTTIPIEARGWGEAQSWHLEVHAPDALNVATLDYEVWDGRTLELVTSGSDGGQASTAHITGGHVAWGRDYQARVRFSPTTPGLVNQVTLGVLISLGLLTAGALVANGIAARLNTPGRGTSVAAVAFSVPAFLLALLSRGPEHHLVSRVLMAPRLVSFASALTLWMAGLLLAWTHVPSQIRFGLGLLATIQAALLLWVGLVRPVGGGP